MGNLGGGEILMILLVALIVLGPTKLPPAVRQIGKVVGELRRIGQGFQQELREAAQPLKEATSTLKEADKELREATRKPVAEMKETLKAADPRKLVEPAAAASVAAGSSTEDSVADKDSAGRSDAPAGEGSAAEGDSDAGSDSADEPEAVAETEAADEPDAVAETEAADEPDPVAETEAADEPDPVAERNSLAAGEEPEATSATPEEAAEPSPHESGSDSDTAEDEPGSVPGTAA